MAQPSIDSAAFESIAEKPSVSNPAFKGEPNETNQSDPTVSSKQHDIHHSESKMPESRSEAADEIDWQVVLTENQSWLRRVLYSRLGEVAAVEECMQEVGLAAVRQAAPIRDTSKLGAWLYQLAVRQALLYRRKMGRKRGLLQRYADRKQPKESDEGAFNPLNWLMDREKIGLVRTALAAIRDEDREILLLKYAENWSYIQISEHLNVSHSAVEARLHRARQRLRKEIERLGKQSGVDYT